MIGTQVLHYRIESKLGEGGMGAVFLATDTTLDRKVALKFLPERISDDRDARERLVGEARAASRLNHPNILTIHAVERLEDRHFIVMEYVEGNPLHDFISRADRPIGTLLDIAIQVAEGLGAAHDGGVIHLDLKPSNILVDRGGRARILDFGLATLVTTACHDISQALVGTAPYMSPEQAYSGAVDHRSDIFSFGVLLYEMISGTRPFAGEHQAEVLYAIVHDTPDLLRRHRSDVPVELENLVLKCLAKKPADRYQSMADVQDDLQKLRRQLEFDRQIQLVGGASVLASIAVLPFVDMSPQRDQEYFCDGMAEEIIHALTRIKELRVVARSSAFSFKGRNVSVQQIGKELSVRTVLTGSVRKSGNRLRIAAQLANTTDGYHVWSDEFDRDEEDVFAIQEEIARRIVDTLKVTLVSEPTASWGLRYTENIESYDLYLIGRYHWNKRTEQSLNKAMGYFKQAIALDPHLALAHVGVADTLIVMKDKGLIQPEEGIAEARAAALRALELNDQLAEAHTSLAMAMTNARDWRPAEAGFQRAIALNPGYATARFWYYTYLMQVGRSEEALEHIQMARNLDPLSVFYNGNLGKYHYLTRQYSLAISQLTTTLELNAHYPQTHLFLYRTYLQLGRDEAALSEIPLWFGYYAGAPVETREIREAYAESGFPGVWRKLLKILRVQNEFSERQCYRMAVLHAQLGQTDEAFRYLHRARDRFAIDISSLQMGPEFDGLRLDPRFEKFLASLGLDT